MRKACTSSEFIAEIIQDIIPEGDFRTRMQLTADNYLDQTQGELSLGSLPTIICSAISDMVEKAIPVTAAWRLIQITAKLFDNIEDGDTTERIAYSTDLATGFLFTAYTALDRLIDYGVSLEQSHQVRVGLNQACLRACVGQDADFQSRYTLDKLDPDCWLEIARKKSGELFAWACQAGGIVAGDDETVQANLWEYGLHLGILVQIADDFNGIWGPAGEIDLYDGQWTLPITYAYFVAQPKEKKVLDELNKCIAQGDRLAVKMTREQITSLGAQKYVLAVAWLQRSEAIEALSCMTLSFPARQQMMVLLDRIFPVLAQIDAQFHGSFTESISTPH